MFQKDIVKQINQIMKIVLIMIKKTPEIHINYLDMNNLYRGAMSQYLLYGGFK